MKLNWMRFTLFIFILGQSALTASNAEQQSGKVPPRAGVSEAHAIGLAYEVKGMCDNNHLMSIHIDCDCLELDAREALLNGQISGNEHSILKDLTNPVNAQCIKRESVYAYNYRPCVDVTRRSRPNDYEQTCACVANSMADSFLSERIFNTHAFHQHRQAGSKQCSTRK